MKKRFSLFLALSFCLLACTEDKLDIVLSRSIMQLEIGDMETLEVQVSPNTSETVIWTSSNEEIATVFNGIVTAVSDGKAEIRATIGEYAAVCIVYVTRQGGSYQGEYQLVWEDNFDGTELNTDFWNIEIGGGGWGNQEKQYYTDRSENLRIEDGCLIIEAKQEQYENNNYTSARITTKNKKDFVYGKIEARISLPSGRGTWPAFWMLGYGSWPTCGEIDIMEHVGSNPTMISHALHTRKKNGSNGTNWSYRATVENVEGEFHIYGIEWLKDYELQRDAIRFYIDDEVSTIQYEPTAEPDFEQWPFNDAFYIILNLAIGGTMGGSINTNIFADPENNPVLMKVDWVRVYQKQI